MLHIVNKSPHDSNSFDSCLRLAAPGAALLLIEDAVYALVKGSDALKRLGEKSADLKLYALGPDLQARGLAERIGDLATIVGYDGFVDLVEEHGTPNSWL
jgi:tRNA 2-thiouridine synthesizing protein B